MGIQPIVFVKRSVVKINNLKRTPKPWIPEMKKVPIEYYNRNFQLSYLLPVLNDEIGLRKVFKKYRCDFVHAHNLETAYYSYRRGLPTLYDDWEYYYERFDYQPKAKASSAFLRYIRKVRVKKILKEIIGNLPVIVTNDEAERRYRELGAKSIWWMPNVPLSYEREYAFAIDVEKKHRITTCYVGPMSIDEGTILRNTSGIRKLWNENDIGDLLVFEDKNYVPHLDVLRKIRECHFNLLFWKPLRVHKYYLQNKAFLASVVGVPTIISSSLKATINLLGEYAVPVNSLEEIPSVIKTFVHSTKYKPNPAHLWEYHQPKIRKAYEATISG